MSPKQSNFNDRHPELRAGEVWLANVATDGDLVFGNLPYQTKRLGEKAYSSSGMEIADGRPVFVQKEELK